MPKIENSVMWRKKECSLRRLPCFSFWLSASPMWSCCRGCELVCDLSRAFKSRFFLNYHSKNLWNNSALLFSLRKMIQYLETDYNLSQIFSKRKNITKIDFVLYPVILCLCAFNNAGILFIGGQCPVRHVLLLINKITFHKLDECPMAITEFYQAFAFFF